MLKFGVSVLLLLFVSMVASAKQVERIIALSPHSVEILFLLGVGEKIVGTVDFADYPEEAKSIPRIGGHTAIQIDRVLELEPDIVIAWESGNPTRDIERIKELGIVVYESTTKELDDIPQEILRIGDKVGRSAEAKVQAQNYRKRLDALRDNYQSSKPVSFFYQLWSKPLRTMAAGSWINQMFAGCGAVNVFDDPSMDYPQVSLESVIDLRPEVIVVPTHHGAEMDFNHWNDWPEIPAVKNDHIVFFNGDLLHRFSYRTLDGMQQICEVFDDIRQSKK